MLNILNKKTNEEKILEIAKNNNVFKKQYLEIDYCKNKIIHYACMFDNLPLFKSSLAFQNEELSNQKNNPLELAFKNHSFKILNFCHNNLGISLNNLYNQYKNPLWWAGFDKKEPLPLDEYIQFLIDKNIDFTEFGQVSCNIYYRLLQDYKFKSLNQLLKYDLVDLNKTIARKDSGGNIYYHFHSFFKNRFNKDKYPELFEIYHYLAKKLEVKKDIIDKLIQDKSRDFLHIILNEKNLKLSATQFLALNKYLIEDWIKNEDIKDKFVKKNGDLIFIEVEFVNEKSFIISSSDIFIKGFDDHKIKKNKLSLKELECYNYTKQTVYYKE